MQRSINKKIGSCLLRFTPNPSPAFLTRHHNSHFPLSRLLTLSQFLHSSPSFNHNLQQPSSYCKFPENGALFFAPRPILRNFLCSCGASLDSNRHYINRSEYFFSLKVDEWCSFIFILIPFCGLMLAFFDLCRFFY